MAGLATSDRAAEQYAELRARRVEHRDGAWIVAGPEEVATALACPDLSVITQAPPPGDAGLLQSRMARFSDGPAHARRRAATLDLVPPAADLEAAAARRTAALLDGRTAPFDAMPLARAVPVAALAECLSAGTSGSGSAADRIAGLVGQLCEALAPVLGAAPDRPDGAAAARELLAVLGTGRAGDADRVDADRVDAAAGLLFQARDATAALIGTALLASAGDPVGDPAAGVERTLRSEPPVQCTRRVATAEVRLGSGRSGDGRPAPVTVPRGAVVWVLLAAAEQGAPAAPATFGSGPHACPGREQAVALARGVLAAIRGGGWRAVADQPVRHEPRPNLRLPARVLVARP